MAHLSAAHVTLRANLQLLLYPVRIFLKALCSLFALFLSMEIWHRTLPLGAWITSDFVFALQLASFNAEALVDLILQTSRHLFIHNQQIIFVYVFFPSIF